MNRGLHQSNTSASLDTATQLFAPSGPEWLDTHLSKPTPRDQRAGLERHHEVLGRPKAVKGGSLQPRPTFCPRPKSNVVSCASSVFLNTSVHRRGERYARQQVICVFHATFIMPCSLSGR